MTEGEAVATTRTYTLKALTDIWTGDANGKGDRLIPTGLLGSIRWWFEVLVRGLGGRVCDPTETNCQDREHCVVCELFGCTGWARKFRFDVLDQNGKVKQGQIKKGHTFQLCFTPLRPIEAEEWGLLDLTIRLIADYGAIGGKTVYKPSDEPNRQNRPQHRDYGLIEIRQGPSVEKKTVDRIKAYVVLENAWRKPSHGDFVWASLEHFWCVNKRYLARQSNNQSTFNEVVGRCVQKSQSQRLSQDTRANRWLAGRQQESKKVFSFKEPAKARRTFGFVQSADKLDEMRHRLKDKAWGDLKDEEFLRGQAILAQLLGQGGTE